MMNYQVTAILCNAKRMTGVEFEFDSDLAPGEFRMEGEDEENIEKFLISPVEPFGMVVFLVSMGRVCESRPLSMLMNIPFVRRVVMFFVGRNVAKSLV
jgi:hypothetical protein